VSKASPATPRIPVREFTLDGPAGPMEVWLRDDCSTDSMRALLTDPHAFVPAPKKRRHARKLSKPRAVYSFEHGDGAARRRVYLKFYRVKDAKGALEEMVRGFRAGRSLRAALEAERRGIPVAPHVGATRSKRGAPLPRESVLVMFGVPHNADVRTVLKRDVERGKARAAFVAALGAFVGHAHAKGLVHGDLKIRNVFVVDVRTPAFALIDFDHALFPRPNSQAMWIGQAHDLRRFVESLRKKVARSELRIALRAYFRTRRLDTKARRRLIRRLRTLMR
jgi:tRNA A-37 threonylcarbamoyl transferase component Bud32